jgi:dCMP deaminase
MSRELRSIMYHIVMLDIAETMSRMATCSRRSVGCVLVNSRRHVIGTGYNGPASGLPHCTDIPCAGAMFKSGQGLDTCEAIHAEQNALLQCGDVHSILSCYSTASPCIQCVKLLMNTGCQNIYFDDEYPHPEAKALWLSKPGTSWISRKDLKTATAYVILKIAPENKASKENN